LKATQRLRATPAAEIRDDEEFELGARNPERLSGSDTTDELFLYPAVRPGTTLQLKKTAYGFRTTCFSYVKVTSWNSVSTYGKDVAFVWLPGFQLFSRSATKGYRLARIAEPRLTGRVALDPSFCLTVSITAGRLSQLKSSTNSSWTALAESVKSSNVKPYCSWNGTFLAVTPFAESEKLITAMFALLTSPFLDCSTQVLLRLWARYGLCVERKNLASCDTSKTNALASSI
jgi:hypothetical protein